MDYSVNKLATVEGREGSWRINSVSGDNVNLEKVGDSDTRITVPKSDIKRTFTPSMYKKGGGVEVTKDDIEILGISRNKISEKEWKSILSMAKYQGGATYILKDEKGLDVIPQIEYEWYVKGKHAKGGKVRSKAALAKDRKYTSDEPHELAYRFKRKSKVQRYNTKEDGGLITDEQREAFIDLADKYYGESGIYAIDYNCGKGFRRTEIVKFVEMHLEDFDTEFQGGTMDDLNELRDKYFIDKLVMENGGSVDSAKTEKIKADIEKLKKVAESKNLGEPIKDKAKAQIKILEAELKKQEGVKKVAKPKAEKPAPIAKPKAKPAAKKDNKNNPMVIAKEIRKDGETFQSALERASKITRKAKEEGKPASEVKLRKKKKVVSVKRTGKAATDYKPRRKKKLSPNAVANRTKRGKAADAKRQALPVGKRISADGNVYYEYRENRADKFQNKVAGRRLAKGGAIKGAGSRAKNQYNKDVDAYKWFIVDLKAKKAISGWEFKSDAQDALTDYDGDKNYKLVAESKLKSIGVANPKQEFKYKG